MYSRSHSFKGSTKSPKTAWRGENLRFQLSSAPSFEECGLDSSLYGEGIPFLTPRESIPPSLRKTSSTASTSPAEPLLPRTLSMPGMTNEASRPETYVDEAGILSFSQRQENLEADTTKYYELMHDFEPHSSLHHHGHVKRKAAPKASHLSSAMVADDGTGENLMAFLAGMPAGDEDSVILNNSRFRDPAVRQRSSALKHSSSSSSSSGAASAHHHHHHHHSKSVHASAEGDHNRSLAQGEHRPILRAIAEEREGQQQQQQQPQEEVASYLAGKSMAEVYAHLKSKASVSEIEEVPDEAGNPKPPPKSVPHHHRSGREVLVDPASSSAAAAEATTSNAAKEGKSANKPPSGRPALSPRIARQESADSQADLQAGGSSEARKRWRRVSNTLTFARRLSSVRDSASDFLEHTSPDPLAVDFHVRSDAGRAGAAAFEGARTRALGGRARAKGRQGMEGMLVQQDKGVVALVKDFYVACLKMPMAHFLVGLFLAPIALGLVFTPLYLFDKAGLEVDGRPLTEDTPIVGRVAAAKQKVSALLNVFLYALSLITSYGGSPVNATSPYCLVVANVNTLMGNFLFVFLSGAVFARMSQPSHPVRCSKKAIIRIDDFSIPLDELKEKFRVFAVRLVLTGPPPCELVGAKICLTFRIFIKLPSGSMFCTTQDLELVRPEVPYLRYGIMVRHIIDKRSPLYGHSMESLSDGDASFSLTISGQERTSMQPIFHLEDYFVCDGDVAWDGDYVDFIHINTEGQRVLDHSKIDEIHVSKETKFGCGGTPQPQKSPEREREKEKEKAKDATKGWSASALRGRKIWSSKSTSFTRADW
ncbi:hypothetical protein Mp_1g10960 [Marchantia polymorpha subsp. ruderalis]|uniref:Inward rectifier potassium channel C-terminal domain-containing protein n=2 Tax=Marchantia polymorpha TaxID=3197 RepID=A0AAF6ANU5_MARPO|nr:hypothetical protein MARPO_0014s0129 [Marchantia polymorpha]BBM98115.1 hypothetical protein Mp_1g10960 [Marchantia polymorpha subsp. ruderalis]|eukprot:PTQ45608.1 hypothetical protein MARPO_0014s0129 [Marchantia polymorpha]